MRVVINTQLDTLHMVLIEDGHNSLRFHVHGDRERAEEFAKMAQAKFQECLTELRKSTKD